MSNRYLLILGTVFIVMMGIVMVSGMWAPSDDFKYNKKIDNFISKQIEINKQQNIRMKKIEQQIKELMVKRP